MASVVKFTQGAVYNQLRHNLRQIARSGNPDIDPARLRQDYVLSPDRGMYISSFVGASEQNTAGCKQAADDALKLFATNDKIKNALRKTASYEPSISPATLENNSVYIYIPDEKLKIYGDLLRIITAQSMEYFSSRPKEHLNKSFCLMVHAPCR